MTALNSIYGFLLKIFLISIILISSDIRSQSLQQTLTLELNNVRFIQALEEIEKRTDFNFLFIEEEFKDELPVSINVKEKSIEEVLEILTLSHNVSFKRIKNNIAVRRIKSRRLRNRFFEKKNSIKGYVKDFRTGKPLIACNVTIEGTTLGTTTNSEGYYEIKLLSTGTYRVVVQYIGYETKKALVKLPENRTVEVDFELEESELRLDEVVITTGTVIPTPVKKLPNTISVITAQDIEKTNPADIIEIIRLSVPGAIYNKELLGQSVLNVRGVSNLSGIMAMKIYVDGVEIADPSAFNFMDPNMIERVEVLPGPQASTIYGSRAMGGVMQIFTKKGIKGTAKFYGRVETMLVDDKYLEGSSPLGQKISLSSRGGKGMFDYSVGMDYKNEAGWIDLLDEQSYNAFGTARFMYKDFIADFSINYSKINRDEAWMPWRYNMAKELGFPLEAPESFYQNAMQTYGLNMTYNVTKNWIHKLTIGSNNYKLYSSQRNPKKLSNLFSLRENTNKRLTLSYNTSYSTKLNQYLSSSITLGADYSNLDKKSLLGETAERFNFSSEIKRTDDSFTSSGYFGLAQLSYTDFLFLTAGLRADKRPEGANDEFTWSPRVGLSAVHQFDKWMLKGRVSWGQAVVIPAKEQILGTETTMRIVLPNPDLKSEVQRGYEIGTDIYYRDLFSLSLTYFNQIPENLIDSEWYPRSDDGRTVIQYQNLSEVKNEGIEISVIVRPFDCCKLKLNYGKTKSTIESVGKNYTGNLKKGESMFGAPDYSIVAVLELYPFEGTSIMLDVIQIDGLKHLDFRLFERDFRTGVYNPDKNYYVKYSTCTKFNLSLSQEITYHLTGFLRIENMTNTDDFEFVNLFETKPRTLILGVRFGGLSL